MSAPRVNSEEAAATCVAWRHWSVSRVDTFLMTADWIDRDRSILNKIDQRHSRHGTGHSSLIERFRALGTDGHCGGRRQHLHASTVDGPLARLADVAYFLPRALFFVRVWLCVACGLVVACVESRRHKIIPMKSH